MDTSKTHACLVKLLVLGDDIDVDVHDKHLALSCGSPTAADEAGAAQEEYTNRSKMANVKRGRRLGEAALFGQILRSIS